MTSWLPPPDQAIQHSSSLLTNVCVCDVMWSKQRGTAASFTPRAVAKLPLDAPEPLHCLLPLAEMRGGNDMSISAAVTGQ